ncbi:MAG: transporter, family, solute carrier family 18 (vesicular acetylcholine transporter), er 3 [Gaiellales bacterium]|nr:transporter, family, solute carrier family 18 (vesicular acetylcholine transporter), er 3 [Gaiellales bacterium]
MKSDRAPSGLLSLYAMIFVSVVADVAVVPLLPTLSSRHGLSSLETALLLSTTTFAMVVITLPLGRLADRIGARPLVGAAGGFVVLGSIVLALADGLPELLAGRTLIGIANGIIWTAGVMIAGAPGRPAGATGRAIAAGGTGLLVGPVLAGLLADRVGTWAPFAAGAVLALPVTVLFALQRSAPVERPSPTAQPRARGAHRNRIVVYAMLATVLLGFVGGMGNLLGTLRLSENGLSPSGIGVLFSIGALVWIAVAPLAGRMGEQRSHVALTAVGCALLGAAWLVPVADRSTLAITAFLLASSAGRAGLNTFSYLLAGTGAQSAGAGRGTVVGLVNLSWGIAAVIGPLAASAAHGHIDERIPFGVVAALCLAVAAFMVTGSRPVAAT